MLQPFGFFAFFFACIFWNVFIFFLLEACHVLFSFFYNNIHGLLFHFYLYNVRDENTFYFEKFDESFFLFCLLQIFLVIIIIPNTCRNLSSLVVHSNVEPKVLERATCGFTNIWLWKKENIFHLYWVRFQKYLCSRKRHLGVPKYMSM
jgi:hypothetical protein